MNLNVLTGGLLAGVMLLSGCASMSPEECKRADWADIGQRDGAAGRTLSRLDDLSKSCAEAGVRVDGTAYRRGRDRGLLGYCQLGNAVRLGLDGKFYEGVCPVVIDAEFRRRFDIGRDSYLARYKIRQLDDRRLDTERKLRDEKDEGKRKQYRDDLSRLDRDLQFARDQLRRAEWDLDRLR